MPGGCQQTAAALRLRQDNNGIGGAHIAQEMYDETGSDGKRRYTVAQIAAEFGVTRPHHLPASRE